MGRYCAIKTNESQIYTTAQINVKVFHTDPNKSEANASITFHLYNMLSAVNERVIQKAY